VPGENSAVSWPMFYAPRVRVHPQARGLRERIIQEWTLARHQKGGWDNFEKKDIAKKNEPEG